MVARVLWVTMQGVWLDLETSGPEFERDEAARTMHASVAAFFPKHFGVDGLLAGAA